MNSQISLSVDKKGTVELTNMETLGTHFRELLDIGQFNIWEWDLKTDTVIDIGHSQSLSIVTGDKDIVGNIKHFANRLHPADREHISIKLMHSITTREDYHADFRIQFLDDHYKWVSARGRYIYDASNKPIKMIGIWRMTCEPKNTQQLNRLQHTTDNRVSRCYLLGEATSSLVHEISQPLCALSAYLLGNIWRLKQGNIEKDQFINMLQKAVEQTETIGNIIQRVQRFVTHGELHFERVNLASLVNSTINLAKYYCNFTGQIECHFDAHLKEVCLDPNQIQQVFLNLINNALEAMEEAQTKHPTLLVKLENFETGIRASVIDNGPGIPEKVLDNLFTAYYSTKEYGFGLGLTLCHKIIEAHGGELTIERNASGEGTLCSFKIPDRIP
jgi:signal transduction histidine kinase